MAQASVSAKPSAIKRLVRYFNDVKAEMRRVVWPSRAEVINSSWIVVITLAIFIVLIFGLDLISGEVVKLLAAIGGN